MPISKKTQSTAIRSKFSFLRLFIFFGFVLAVSNALSAYIHSSYLADFFGQKNIGWIFTASYLLTLIAVNNFTAFINRLKIFKAGLFVFIAIIISLLALGIASNPILVAIFFLAYIVFLNLIWIIFDIYVEYFSRDQITGRVRGLYWTGIHIAWFLSPIISGLILENFNYQFIFLIAALIVLAAMAGFNFKFSRLEINHFPKANFFLALKNVSKNRLLNKIFVINFLLQAFYCAMVVYAPIYLRQYLGFSWQEIGLMFTIMLSTFVFITYPAGWLADKFLGEKEMLSIGLLIMGASTVIFGLIKSNDFWLWTFILFLTRVGASLIDIMKDAYFFKRIDARDINTINLFRNMGPLAYIIVPILITVLLQFFGYQSIFLVVGGLVLGGLWFSLRLKDTL